MTANESETTTESPTDDPATNDSSPEDPESPTDDGEEQNDESEIEALRDELEATKERLRAVERNLRWMAQQQAAETGKSICPQCNSGGALTVERTATGKKKVQCTNCGQRFI
ncbi:hypothetical protein [Haladaptatus sp. NG-SE-30]